MLACLDEFNMSSDIIILQPGSPITLKMKVSKVDMSSLAEDLQLHLNWANLKVIFSIR